MIVSTDERVVVELVESAAPVEPVELTDLGDASVETRQVWFGQLPDSQFGLGFFRD